MSRVTDSAGSATGPASRTSLPSTPWLCRYWDTRRACSRSGAWPTTKCWCSTWSWLTMSSVGLVRRRPSRRVLASVPRVGAGYTCASGGFARRASGYFDPHDEHLGRTRHGRDRATRRAPGAAGPPAPARPSSSTRRPASAPKPGPPASCGRRSSATPARCGIPAATGPGSTGSTATGAASPRRRAEAAGFRVRFPSTTRRKRNPAAYSQDLWRSGDHAAGVVSTAGGSPGPSRSGLVSARVRIGRIVDGLIQGAPQEFGRELRVL